MTQLHSPASQGLPPFFFVSVILILVSYVGVDITTHITEYLSRGSLSMSEVDARMKLNQGNELLSSRQEQEERFCSTALGHLPDKLGEKDPWFKQMKWVGKPAQCKVKGQLIESLDDNYNFQRGLDSLKYVKDAKDRAHIIPWLLGSNINLNLRKRRVYLDLGANSFQTSIEWFMVMYPCDFTEIHAFEVDDQLLDFPEVEGNEESKNYAPDDDKALRVKERLGIPKWMLKRMRFYYTHVADGDEYSSSPDHNFNILSAINITHFIKEGLKLTVADTVVVKMDIEGREWPILKRWLKEPQMAEIVDELFVEIHYNQNSSTQSEFNWNSYPGAPHTREQATHLIADLHSKNFFVHVWPG